MAIIVGIGMLLGGLTVIYMVSEQHRVTNALLLGSDPRAEELLRAPDTDDLPARFNIVAFVHTGDSDTLSPQSLSNQSGQNLLQLSTELNAKTIIVAASAADIAVWKQQLLDCKLNGIDIVDSSIFAPQAHPARASLRSPGNILHQTG